MLKRMLPYVKGHRLQTVLSAVTIILEVILEVYIPYIMADVINIGINGEGGMPFILAAGGKMIGLAVLSLFFGVVSARFAVLASTGFARNLRRALFYKVQDYSFANVDKFSTASLITRLTTDVNNTQQSFMMSIRMLIRAPVMLVSATVMALSINADMGVVFAFALPVLSISLAVIAVKAFPRFQAMLKKYDGMNRDVQENLTAIRVVKAFVRGEYETDRFASSADEVRAAQLKAERVLIWNMPIAQFVLYACMIATCWIGGNNIIAGRMQAGDLMSFISYLAQILNALMMISMVFVNLVLSRASITRIGEALDEKIDIRDDGAEESLNVRDGSIAFKNVTFSYSKKPDNLTLSHISLSILSGETIGVIGGTGSAKTTLVQLIPRLYDTLSGSVEVGGRDVRDYKINRLRDAVSMVLQNNVLFSGTIRDNLRWGNPSATDEQIEEACRAAQAHEFIMSFPDGYDTNLGQGGVNVSGGQKQRLCIARALLKKPKIIILDDSTSAVDTATDAAIRSALRNQLRDTTTIIIAQRIASVMDSDRIVVLNDGMIEAVGTHEELLKTNHIYQEVYNSQQKGVA